MNTASLELCKELYSLGRWEPEELIGHGEYCDLRHWVDFPAGRPTVQPQLSPGYHYEQRICPAYDLGYLMAKLPSHWENGCGLVLGQGVTQWYAGYQADNHDIKSAVYADTAEDAACKLAIELFKKGILLKV